MRISPWTKVLLLGFWLGGFAGFVRADTVIVVELMDSEQLVGVPGEVALASDDSSGLVSRHAKSDAGGQVQNLSPIESLLQYRFAMPKPLKARPELEGRKTAPL